MVKSTFGKGSFPGESEQNVIKKYLTRLKDRNYIVKAEPQKNGGYWFNFYQNKLTKNYIARYKKEFSLIIHGSDSQKMDFFAIPYSDLEDFLTPWFVYIDEKTDVRRWIFNINRDHILQTRGYELNVGPYYGNLSYVFDLPEEIEYKPTKLF